MKLDKRWNGPRVANGETSALCADYLSPDDGAMCCIGIYGAEKGLPVEEMRGRGEPAEIENFPDRDIFEQEVDFGEVCAVLRTIGSIDSVLPELGKNYAMHYAGRERNPYLVQTPIICINDSETLDLYTKAQAIKILFEHYFDEEVDISEYTKGD